MFNTFVIGPANHLITRSYELGEGVYGQVSQWPVVGKTVVHIGGIAQNVAKEYGGAIFLTGHIALTAILAYATGKQCMKSRFIYQSRQRQLNSKRHSPNFPSPETKEVTPLPMKDLAITCLVAVFFMYSTYSLYRTLTK